MVALLFVLGLVFGSFFNVVIYRVPKGESILYPNSRCSSCGKALEVIELLPVVSFLLQRGRCRGCKAAFSVQYPFVELLTAGIFTFQYTIHGLSLAMVSGIVFFSLLLILSLIDLRHKILPNVLTLPGMIAGLVFGILGATVSWQSSLYGFLVGGGLLFVVALLSKGGMGMGDVKLLAMVGVYLGPLPALGTLFAGSALGSVLGIGYLIYTKQDRKTPIPFGPFLAVGAVIAYCYYLV